MLASFWEQHNPRHPSYSRQYRSAIFFITSTQQQQAQALKNQLENTLDGNLYTAIEAAGMFTPAEDYHQKYYLQHNPQLMALLRPLFPDLQQLFDSTVAARLNAFLAGNASREQVLLACEQAGLASRLVRELDKIFQLA